MAGVSAQAAAAIDNARRSQAACGGIGPCRACQAGQFDCDKPTLASTRARGYLRPAGVVPIPRLAARLPRPPRGRAAPLLARMAGPPRGLIAARNILTKRRCKAALA